MRNRHLTSRRTRRQTGNRNVSLWPARIGVNLLLVAGLGIANTWLVLHIWAEIAQSAFLYELIEEYAESVWLRPYLVVQDLMINIVLYAPLAALICLLRPRRLILYVSVAVLASQAWMALSTPVPLIDQLLAVRAASWALEILPLPLAVALMSRWIGRPPPDHPLETDTGPPHAA